MKPEILSPCGSVQALKGAIASGADAVYIGGRKFGARAYADNPERDELLDAIDFVHLNGKKIYMTVNTLLKEDELEKDLYAEIKPYYERGLDAVIVQDLGVMDLIRREFPGMHIHASTQTTITGSFGAELLKKHFGITRVVPARELSLSEIRALRNETDLELECFVHGALCYCYSGQCLMSSMIGGRSGNRGRCAQPCRQRYDLLEDGKKTASGYLLSLKDMCTAGILPDLIDAGIDSFKIEGRMKRPEYTAGITAAYRYLTDLYVSLGREKYEKELNDHPEILEEQITNAKELYNRGGFSKGYYLSYHGNDMMCPDRPNHSGITAGTVVSNNAGLIKIRPDVTFNKGDVLEIQGGDAFEFTVGQDALREMGEDKNGYYKVNAPKALDIGKGSEVIRTKNAALLKDIEDAYLKKDCKSKASGILKAKPDEPLFFAVTLFGVTAEATGNIISTAQSKPSTVEDMEAVLRKTGESVFDLDEIKIETTGDAFVPVGALKSIRREAFDKLKDAIIAKCSRTSQAGKTFGKNAEIQQGTDAPENETEDTKKKLVISVSTKEQLEAVYELQDSNETEIWLDLLDESIEEQKKAYDDAESKGFTCYLALPHIFRKKEAEKYSKALDLSRYKVIVNSFDELGFVLSHEDKKGFKLSGSVYVMNNRTAAVLRKICGRNMDNSLTVSLELNAQELKKTDLSGLILQIYGRVPLMYTAQCIRDNYRTCLKKSVTDRIPELVIRDTKDANFPVRTACGSCINIIYNSKIYSLLTHNEAGEYCYLQEYPGAVLVSFTFEDKDETKEVLTALKNGEELTGKAYTRGAFNRTIE